jgi:hypothetical protein
MKTNDVLEALGDLYGLSRDPVVLDAMGEIESQRETIARLAGMIMANVLLVERLFKAGHLTEEEFIAFSKGSQAYLMDCGIQVHDNRAVISGLN